MKAKLATEKLLELWILLGINPLDGLLGPHIFDHFLLIYLFTLHSTHDREEIDLLLAKASMRSIYSWSGRGKKKAEKQRVGNVPTCSGASTLEVSVRV
jgi:hypothetical protein